MPRAMSNGKAPGEDDIPAEIFKENKDVLLPQLHALLPQCWRQRGIPHTMRDAQIVTLYKNGVTRVTAIITGEYLSFLRPVRSSLRSS